MIGVEFLEILEVNSGFPVLLTLRSSSGIPSVDKWVNENPQNRAEQQFRSALFYNKYW